MKKRHYLSWCLTLSVVFTQPSMGATPARAAPGGSIMSPAGLSAGLSAALKTYFMDNKNTELSHLYASSDLKILDKTDTNILSAKPSKSQTQDLMYAFMAGVTDTPGKNAMKTGFSFFGGGASGAYDPQKLYQALENHAQACQFLSSDALFNPQSKVSPARMALMEDVNSVDNLSFNSIFSPTEDTFQHFICNIAPSSPPSSLQNFLFGLNQTHAGDLKKHDKVTFYDPKQITILKSSLSDVMSYQQQRRRALAFQFVAMNNLAMIRQAYLQDQTEEKNSLSKQLIGDMSQVTKMTSVEVARMNLLANVLILKEMKKDHLIHELTLATLSLMLAQGNTASSQMLSMTRRKAEKQLRQLLGVPDPKPSKPQTKS